MFNTADGIAGRIEGITLSSFLQLLNSEGRSCRLVVNSHGRQGTFFLMDGQIANAVYEQLAAEASAYEMIGWEEVQIQIEPVAAATVRTLHLPLEHILMEAARLADEKAFQERSKPSHENRLLAPDAHSASGSDLQELTTFKEIQMDNVNEILQDAMGIEGALGVALVAIDSGMALGKAGGGTNLNLDVAAAGNTSVVKAKLRVMDDLGFRNENIEDILITLGHQYHLIRLLGSDQSLFLYLVLNRSTANLAMARHKLAGIERKVII
jgi:hypothetical protein